MPRQKKAKNWGKCLAFIKKKKSQLINKEWDFIYIYTYIHILGVFAKIIRKKLTVDFLTILIKSIVIESI